MGGSRTELSWQRAKIAGVHCHTKQFYEEALRCLEAQRFDCVLMDIQMPVMDGLQATQQLRTMEQTSGRARTPVVALTANTMQGDRERYLAAGMDGFLAKPYDKRTLLAAVESVLPKTPAITP